MFGITNVCFSFHRKKFNVIFLTISPVYSKHSKNVYLWPPFICDHLLWRRKPTGKAWFHSFNTLTFIFITCDAHFLLVMYLTEWRCGNTDLSLDWCCLWSSLCSQFGWDLLGNGKEEKYKPILRDLIIIMLLFINICPISHVEAKHGTRNDPGQCSWNVPS